jgi:transposase
MSKASSAHVLTASSLAQGQDSKGVLSQDALSEWALSEAQRACVEGWLAGQQARYEMHFEHRLAQQQAQFDMQWANQHATIEARLKSEIEARLQAEFDARVQALYEQIRLARQRLFGRSSESHAGQGGLFDEAEATLAAESMPTSETEACAPAHAAQTASAQPSTDKARGKRRPLPPELPRVEVFHEVPETARRCACGALMQPIAEEVSEQLDIVPLQIRVLRHHRKRYACACGQCAPRTAPPAPQVLPKSLASNDLLAMLLTTKYVDGLPLARFEYVLGRAGVGVPRQTLARWVIGCANALQPVANLLRDSLLEHDLIHMDETPIQVPKEAGRSATSPRYMWVQRGGPPERPVILFDYDPSRAGAVPLRLLADWQGYLMSDGYEGYASVAAQPGVVHLACWVHARRHFVDAAKLHSHPKQGRAHQALELIAQLYAIEKQHRTASIEVRAHARQTQSRAVLERLRTWLEEALPGTPPKSALGQALAYLQKYWPRLVRYIERGDLPIDNNPAENAIRPFVVGRKAWLFADTPAGAHASALIYSLVETAKANGLEPYTWLRHVLQHLPNATTVEHYEALLPWHFKCEHLATP